MDKVTFVTPNTRFVFNKSYSLEGILHDISNKVVRLRGLRSLKIGINKKRDHFPPLIS